jgi:hypothetical protein
VPTESDFGSEDDWKWSVSAKRTLFASVAVSARVANDHLRFEQAGGGVELWERMVGPDNWYWSLTVHYAF